MGRRGSIDLCCYVFDVNITADDGWIFPSPYITRQSLGYNRINSILINLQFQCDAFEGLAGRLHHLFPRESGASEADLSWHWMFSEHRA